MHMADALVSPTVGGIFWAGSIMTGTYAARKLRMDLDDKKIPLMGVMGAFIFTAQMINFTIPGTGSSGHIGGGTLLAILLGPFAGFMAMASVLLIQALFFADGGLLAFGCNLFNLGFFTCFVAYPLYNALTKNKKNKGTLAIVSILSVMVAMQLGSLSVVLQTFLSGKTELPFRTFLMFMQPIHLAIGIVEGAITAAVILFLRQARPDIIFNSAGPTNKVWSYKSVIVVIVIGALLITGTWFASSHPDGLEWSIEKVTGSTELESSSEMNSSFNDIQEKTTILPDYQFKEVGEDNPAVQIAGTSISGLSGSAMTLGLMTLIALITAFFKKKGTANRKV